jgi:hypothetical protein
VAAYLIEAGVLLTIGPWTPLWEQNYFAAELPAAAAFFGHPSVRGGVSGVGLVTLAAGLRDLVSAVALRQARRAAANPESAPPAP